jgi:hypothetical protein
MLAFLYDMIIFEAFIALIFLQTLICGLMLFLYFQYKRLQSLARTLNFKYLTGTFPHPKFEGDYKKNWWQLHFLSKDEGEQWGMPRTYIKLQWKEKKLFDAAKLEKYRNIDYKGNKIIEVKHVARENKNYLLLKRVLITFDKKRIYELMDFLLDIARKAQIKKN